MQENHFQPNTVLKERYLVGAVLKDGASNVTYQGYDKLWAKFVAIKTVKPHGKPEAFLEEAKSLFGKYDQAGMPAVTDVFTDKGTACFVMGFLHGESLEEFLKKQPRGRMKVQDAVKMLLPVMETLSYWHSQGLVHGGVTEDNLMFDENGVCRLLGWGNCQERHGDGPWMDVYGICAVLYRCVTGRNIQNSRKRFHKDQVKPLSDYVEMELAAEQAILQGLAAWPAERFFCLGALVEQMGAMENPLLFYTDAISARWGEKWLSMTTERGMKNNSRRRYFLTRRQKKRIAYGISTVCLAVVLGAAGLLFYTKKNPDKVLEYQLQKDLAYAKEHPLRRITKDSENYEEIRNYAKKYGTKTEEEKGFYYSLSQQEILYGKLTSTKYETFPVREEQILAFLEQYWGTAYKDSSVVQQQNGVLVGSGYMENVTVEGYETVEYLFPIDFENHSVQITRDIVNDYVICLEIADSLEGCPKLVEALMPILAPELSVTTEGLAEMFQMAEEEGYYSYKENPKIFVEIDYNKPIEISGAETIDAYYAVTMQTCLLQDVPLTDENGAVLTCAGNYAGESAEYEEFLDFVKAKAISVNVDKDYTEYQGGRGCKAIYEIDKDTVLTIGQPCNANKLSVTCDDFVRNMQSMGYSMDKSVDIMFEAQECLGLVQEYSFGAISTLFQDGKAYDLGDGMEITVFYDVVSQHILSAYIWDSGKNLELCAERATDMLDALSEDVNREVNWQQANEKIYQALDTDLQDYSVDSYYDYEDCGFWASNEESGYYVHMERYEDQSEIAPYHWLRG